MKFLICYKTKNGSIKEHGFECEFDARDVVEKIAKEKIKLVSGDDAKFLCVTRTDNNNTENTR